MDIDRRRLYPAPGIGGRTIPSFAGNCQKKNGKEKDSCNGLSQIDVCCFHVFVPFVLWIDFNAVKVKLSHKVDLTVLTPNASSLENVL